MLLRPYQLVIRQQNASFPAFGEVQNETTNGVFYFWLKSSLGSRRKRGRGVRTWEKMGDWGIAPRPQFFSRILASFPLLCLRLLCRLVGLSLLNGYALSSLLPNCKWLVSETVAGIYKNSEFSKIFEWPSATIKVGTQLVTSLKDQVPLCELPIFAKKCSRKESKFGPCD